MRIPYNGIFPTTQGWNDACCRASYAKFGMQGHNGIDYGLPCGTPVVAAFNGTVYSGNEPGGYGNYIFLRDDAGNEAVYGHLSKIQVPSGRVSEGQQIGLSGTTGNSSGCHLHFGYRPAGYNRNNGFLGYVNPIFSQSNNSTGGNVIIQNGDNWFNRLSQLQRQVQGSKVPFTRNDFNWWVGKDTLTFIEALSDSKEAKSRENAGNVGEVAVKDRWDQQIYTLQDQLAAANKKLVELEQKPVPVPPVNLDKETVDHIKETNSIVKQIRDFLTNIFKGK